MNEVGESLTVILMYVGKKNSISSSTSKYLDTFPKLFSVFLVKTSRLITSFPAF